VATDQPDQLLADLAALRADTRSARHAYWLPVGVFGLLITAAAPLYVTPSQTCLGAGCGGGVVVGGRTRTLLAGLGGGATGLYWAFTIVVGVVVTAAWYAWYGRVSGVRTQVRLPVLSWTLGLLAVVVGVAALSLVGLALVLVAYGRSFLPLLVIGVGLVVLGRMERSRLLVVVAVGLCAWAVLCALYNVENLAYRVVAMMGAPDGSMPPWATTVSVVVPGVALLITAAVAFVVDLRRR